MCTYIWKLLIYMTTYLDSGMQICGPDVVAHHLAGIQAYWQCRLWYLVLRVSTIYMSHIKKYSVCGCISNIFCNLFSFTSHTCHINICLCHCRRSGCEPCKVKTDCKTPCNCAVCNKKIQVHGYMKFVPICYILMHADWRMGTGVG